jgi:hypothetical protein
MATLTLEEWQIQWNAQCVERDKRLAALSTAAEMSDEFVTLREECRALGIGMNHSVIVSCLFDSAYKVICGVTTTLEEKQAKLAEVRAFVAKVRNMSPNARQGFTRPQRPAPIPFSVQQDNERKHVEARRQAILAAIAEVEAAGGMVAQAPNLQNGAPAIQLIKITVDQVSAEARAALLGDNAQLVSHILRERSGMPE